MFSLNHYIDVANTYIKGLKTAYANGYNLSGIHSVASIFISRVDTMVDKAINDLISGEAANDTAKKEKLAALIGKAGVANSKIIFNKFNEIFNGGDFSALKSKGANPQRLLFASTSTKNPSYYDLKYVEPFIGKNTVNTLPDETIEHIADHGNIMPDTASLEFDESLKTVNALMELGIDLNKVGEKLQNDGVKSFEDAYEKLLQSIKNTAGI